MNYRSVSDLDEGVRRWAMDLPEEFDLIAGNPRSGLLVANLLALHRNRPLTDVDGLCEGRLVDTGRRYDGGVTSVADAERVLVVDDSVNTGRSMAETRDRIERHDPPFDVEYGATYVSVDGHRHVDHWHEVVPQPRVFEWNVMHHSNLQNWCVDIDGVLCRDPTDEENDDGRRYRAFVESVDPRVVPSKPIGWLVTCRLEKYRAATEAWLDRHGIEYDELVMMDHPDMVTRRRAGNHAEYKAAVYESTGADFFVESSPRQAAEIASLAGRPVYCFETNRLVEPGRLERVRERGDTYLSDFVRNPLAFSVNATRYVVQRGLHRIDAAVD